MAHDISITANVLDVRDIISRVEELRDDRADPEFNANSLGTAWADANPEEAEELATLEAFLAQMAGAGGDELWEGSWYPVTLVRDRYFREYAEELANDIGAIDKNARWPCCHIDWDAAANSLKQDYTSAKFDGETYWFR